MSLSSTTSSRTRPAVLAGAALVGALTLSACGSGSSGASTPPAGSTGVGASSYGPSASGPHNAADVSFATDMVPHHSEAVQMASMALQQGSNARVKQLATTIKGGQDPEINTMSGWLAGWGKPVPKSGSMTGMGGNTAMPGMMTDAETQQLASAKGPAFDRLWVALMTKHHKGAITMAQTELRDGQNSDAKTLAGKIIQEQSGEVATMAALAKALPA